MDLDNLLEEVGFETFIAMVIQAIFRKSQESNNILNFSIMAECVIKLREINKKWRDR